MTSPVAAAFMRHGFFLDDRFWDSLFFVMDRLILHVTIFRDFLGFFIFIDVNDRIILFLFLSIAIHFLRFLKIQICWKW